MSVAVATLENEISEPWSRMTDIVSFSRTVVAGSMLSDVPLQKVSLTLPVAERPLELEQKTFLWDAGNLSVKLLKQPENWCLRFVWG